MPNAKVHDSSPKRSICWRASGRLSPTISSELPMTGSPDVPMTGFRPLPGGGSASGLAGVSGSRRATAATACWARNESGGPLRTVSRTVIAFASPYPSVWNGRSDDGDPQARGRPERGRAEAGHNLNLVGAALAERAPQRAGVELDAVLARGARGADGLPDELAPVPRAPVDAEAHDAGAGLERHRQLEPVEGGLLARDALARPQSSEREDRRARPRGRLARARRRAAGA